MKTITPMKDSACVRGTFSSLLEDCACSEVVKTNIMQEIEKRTIGNNTEINITEIEGILSEILSVEEITNYLEVEDFNKLPEIDNEEKFGILFWNGNGNGENHHCTRYVSSDQDGITLMDPRFDNIVKYTHTKLFEAVPLGFHLVLLKK